MPSHTIRQALAEANRILRRLPGPVTDTDARVLLGIVLDRPQSHLYAWPEQVLETSIQRQFDALVHRRANGEPLAHLTGRREFWSLDLKVSPETLIPRPESELLVERALIYIPLDEPVDVLDLGTGSGAVALAIASEQPACRVTATDISPNALRVAEQNIKRLGLSNIETIVGRWFRSLPAERRFHLIVSNPPYIATGDAHLSTGDLTWEPIWALESGPDGLDAIREIVTQATQHLHPRGRLLLEHGYDQGASVREMINNAGFRNVKTHRDLASLERITEGQID